MLLYSRLIQRNIHTLTRRFIQPSYSIKYIPLTYCKQDVRTLYSSSNLGIDGLVYLSEKLRNEYQYKDKFLQKFQNNSADEVFYTDDLRLLIAYCQEDKSLLNDVIKFSKLYYNQIKDLHIEPYKFGPILMRLLHYHNCPDEALKMVLDEEYGTFFHQLSSYQILMDLLYENQRYDDVKIIMEKIILQNLFNLPTSCLNLVLASNYKIGTEEALEDSLVLLRRASVDKNRVQLRTVGFAAGLAIKLHKPQVALEILYKSDSGSYFITNNLKILSQAQLGQVNEVLAFIKMRALTDSSKSLKAHSKHIFCSEVIDEIEKIVNDTLEMQPIAEMKHLKQVLKSMNFIDNDTLENIVCSSIEGKRPHEEIDNVNQSKYNNRRNPRSSNVY